MVPILLSWRGFRAARDGWFVDLSFSQFNLGRKFFINSKSKLHFLLENLFGTKEQLSFYCKKHHYSKKKSLIQHYFLSPLLFGINIAVLIDQLNIHPLWTQNIILVDGYKLQIISYFWKIIAFPLELEIKFVF